MDRPPSRFKHITEGVLDSIPAPDEYASVCIEVMRQMLKVGKDKWIQNELANPSMDDPDWTNFIVKNMLGNEPLPPPKISPAQNQKLFRCLECLDVGLKYKGEMVGMCSCAKGLRMKTLWADIDKKRGRPARTGRRRITEEEDPREPIEE